MSLDGFVNDRTGSVDALYPDLDALRKTTFLQELIDNTGAVVMGRHAFDMADDPDWFAGNYEFQRNLPVFQTRFKNCATTVGSKCVPTFVWM